MKLHPQKATQQQTRSYNSSLVLKTIYDQGRISRADVARLTDLTRTSVSELVSELQERGLVEEVGVGQSLGGRSPILLSVVDDARHLISLDLASSGFRGGVVNLGNEVVARSDRARSGPTRQSALERVYRLIDNLLDKTDKPILGIGIGTPGLVDTTNGVVVRAVNLGWRDMPISMHIEERYGIPVYAANDSQITALAQYMFNKRLTGNLVVIKTGEGVGAGIVLNGQLFQGDGFGAGEIGHIVVEDGGTPCACGNSGCLETVISTQGIVKRAKDLAAANPQSRLNSAQGEVTLGSIRAAVQSGDETAHRVLQEVGRYLGIACANLVGTVNIARIVLAGSITTLGIPLLELTQQEMSKRVLPMLAKSTHLELASPNPDVVIQGASALVLTKALGFSLTR